MNLNVTVAGLCLLVSDKDGKHAHVLMPKTDGDPKHDHVPTVSLISPSHNYSHSAQRLRLQWKQGFGSQTSVAWPNVIDVGALLDRRHLDMGRLNANAGRLLSAWITLPLGPGADSEPQPGTAVEFNLDGKEVWLTHMIKWTIFDVVAEELEWGWGEFGGGVTVTDLDPNDGGPIEMTVGHCPRKEPSISFGDPAPHFTFYYKLFADDVSHPAPVLRDRNLHGPTGPCHPEAPAPATPSIGQGNKPGTRGVRESHQHHLDHADASGIDPQPERDQAAEASSDKDHDDPKGGSAFSCMLASGVAQ